jgi:hypothetical protein
MATCFANMQSRGSFTKRCILFFVGEGTYTNDVGATFWSWIAKKQFIQIVEKYSNDVGDDLSVVLIINDNPYGLMILLSCFLF